MDLPRSSQGRRAPGNGKHDALEEDAGTRALKLVPVAVERSLSSGPGRATDRTMQDAKTRLVALRGGSCSLTRFKGIHVTHAPETIAEVA
jgi:hypothetical protein